MQGMAGTQGCSLLDNTISIMTHRILEAVRYAPEEREPSTAHRLALGHLISNLLLHGSRVHDSFGPQDTHEVAQLDLGFGRVQQALPYQLLLLLLTLHALLRSDLLALLQF